MTWEDNIWACPHCGEEELVPASGNPSSPILVIGEFPGDDEIKRGKPMVGGTGKIFKIELAKVGIDMRQLRLCNLWLHKPNGNDDCLIYSATKAIEEAKDREAILLVGSTTVKYFCNKAVSNVTGLKVEADMLSAPIIMACLQPAVVFHNVVGELRLSLQKFSNEVGHLL